MESEKTQESVRAVDRALEILLAFRPGDTELTVAELLKRVDLSRPTLYRLLNALEHNDFLVSSGDPQRFRLGSSVARLTHVWTSSHHIADMAQPSLRHLWQTTGETVALFVPEGIYRACVAEIASPQPLSFKRGVGYREKLVLGASGRSILAYMNLAPAEMESFADDPGIDLARYPKELEHIRKQGYATSHHELIAGAVAVAAPFFDGADRVAGSICIFGPSARVTNEQVKKFGDLLVQEANVLSKALGKRV